MSAERLPGALLPLLYVLAVLVLSGVGAVWMLRYERRHPSSYTGQQEALKDAGVPSLADWRRMSTGQQRAYDDAVLGGQEAAAAVDHRVAMERAGERAVERAAEINVLHHP